MSEPEAGLTHLVMESNLRLPLPVVEAEWLLERVDAPGLVLADLRGTSAGPGKGTARYRSDEQAYLDGHIEGAHFVDWTKDIIDLMSDAPFQVARPEHYEKIISRMGIELESTVIAYDDYPNSLATRFVWTLRYYGHERNAILNGGVSAWKRAGGQFTTEVPKPVETGFTPVPQPERRRTLEEVREGLESDVVLIDARAAKEYSGDDSRSERHGRVPGAHNVPFKSIIGTDDRYLAREELTSVFRESGLDPAQLRDREVVVYCNGGVTATSVATALELAGGPQAAIYDGSWNEWGNRADVPVVRD